MGKKNEKEKSKKDEIVKRREAEGFLPNIPSVTSAGKGKADLSGDSSARLSGSKLFSRRRRERFIPQDGTWWHFLA